jgi:hypothetical protein
MKPYRLVGFFVLLGALAFGQTVRMNPDEGTPLLSASLSLQVARSHILEGEPQAAEAALRAAAGHLAAYEVLSPGPQAGQAEFIRQQILQQTARMNDDPYELCDRIVYLWLAPVEHWYFRAGS